MTRNLPIRIPVGAVAVLLLSAAVVGAQANLQESSVLVGDLRLFAIDPANHSAIQALHHAGWIEADGRTLKCDDFALLFARVGRSWTKKKVASDRFAVPDLVDRRANDPNPYGVLGPSDLVTGGREIQPRPTPIYFIYTGKDVTTMTDRPQPPR